MVSLDPKLWPNMEQLKDHSSIALVNCDIQKAKRKGCTNSGQLRTGASYTYVLRARAEVNGEN